MYILSHCSGASVLTFKYLHIFMIYWRSHMLSDKYSHIGMGSTPLLRNLMRNTMILIVIFLAPSFWWNLPSRVIHKLKVGLSWRWGLSTMLGCSNSCMLQDTPTWIACWWWVRSLPFAHVSRTDEWELKALDEFIMMKEQCTRVHGCCLLCFSYSPTSTNEIYRT
jgi:hypothetical protein